MFFSRRIAYVSLLAFATSVFAETHTVTMVNRCGFGTPHLISQGNIVSTGRPFTSGGPLPASLAFLQTGKCHNLDGTGCMTVELTLKDPDPFAPGSGSSVDLSMIPPLAFSVPTSFSYVGGCDGVGASCASATCPDVFRIDSDWFAQRACQENDVNLQVTFC